MVAGVTRKSLAPFIPDELAFYPHQIDGVRQLIRMNSFLLADEMGLGKSLQALTVFAADVKVGVAGPSPIMLVVCPVTLKGNWADEIAEHTGFSATVLGSDYHVNKQGKRVLRTLSAKDRSNQIALFAQASGPRILILNYEQVRPHLAELNALKAHVRCFDEAHYLKNHKAQRTKACIALKARRTFLLTGSPMLNQVNELWPLLHMISPGEYSGYWKFVNRYCLFGGFENKQIIGIKNRKELVERLGRHQVRRLKRDVLDLPEVQITKLKVDLLPEQRKVYDELAAEIHPDLSADMSDGEVENALRKFLRLKQACATLACFEGMDDVSAKLDLAVERIEEMIENGEKVVVFTQMRPVLAALGNRLAKPKIPTWHLHGDIPQNERVPIVKTWGDSSEPGVIACMLQVAGIGLNMTKARKGIFLDKLFVPKLNQQAIDRLHRIGQSESQPVEFLDILARNTIDTRIEAILRGKDATFNSTVEEANIRRQLAIALMTPDEEE